MTTIPLVRYHDLLDLSDAGYELAVTAGPDDLHRLAEWAGVDAVSRLEARIRVFPRSRSEFLLETEFEADILQTCVVTLAPLESHIVRSFTRTLRLVPDVQRHADRGGLVPPAAAEDDAPDAIETLRYDLAAPLREEFALAIDPYPRAPGAEFESPGDDARPENPFTVLEKLKKHG
ncbi:MAG TPA: hypothetical protein VHX61_09055 [Rhizomicrobium sp.]|jgi:hypothetical protein|nr:hypothetical protein [Rhizomicrobium sp.]